MVAAEEAAWAHLHAERAAAIRQAATDFCIRSHVYDRQGKQRQDQLSLSHYDNSRSPYACNMTSLKNYQKV
jgi:hypothetical protein